MHHTPQAAQTAQTRPQTDSFQDGKASPMEYLRQILTARIYDIARETELDAARGLSARLGNPVFFKREDNQPVFSFKVRGAYNKMRNTPQAALDRGVITASAGNHAQGVAISAAKMGVRAIIVVPQTTPQVKVDAVKSHGGPTVTVVQSGDSYSDAFAHAQNLARAQDLTFIPAFDDPYVIAGQGTVGMEILRQHAGPLHAVFVPIGGGGLAAGVATYIKAVDPGVKVIGVQTEDSCAMSLSMQVGERVNLPEVGLFSDGTAVKLVGEETFRLCREYLDEIILVDTDAVCAAIKDVFLDTRSVLEPAGALAVAGLKKYVERDGVQGRPMVAVTSGANMNFDRLRFVADRAEVGEAREAVFAVTVPEERGSFRRFCSVIGQRSVTEFNYRIADARTAHIFVSMQIARRGDAAEIMTALQEQGFSVGDLSNNEVSKQHIRYMVGGRSPLAGGERLFRFEFPERPGALMKFLSEMAPNWNISLFHYRNQGTEFSSALVGIQAPLADSAALDAFLRQLGYSHTEETGNEAYRQFLI